MTRLDIKPVPYQACPVEQSVLLKQIMINQKAIIGALCFTTKTLPGAVVQYTHLYQAREATNLLLSKMTGDPSFLDFTVEGIRALHRIRTGKPLFRTSTQIGVEMANNPNKTVHEVLELLLRSAKYDYTTVANEHHVRQTYQEVYEEPLHLDDSSVQQAMKLGLGDMWETIRILKRWAVQMGDYGRVTDVLNAADQVRRVRQRIEDEQRSKSKLQDVKPSSKLKTFLNTLERWLSGKAKD